MEQVAGWRSPARDLQGQVRVERNPIDKLRTGLRLLKTLSDPVGNAGIAGSDKRSLTIGQPVLSKSITEPALPESYGLIPRHPVEAISTHAVERKIVKAKSGQTIGHAVL